MKCSSELSLELIQYLSRHFLSERQLLTLAGISVQQLQQFQKLQMMPKPSYRLMIDLTSSSFFGHHQLSEAVSFYPKAYAAWLTGLDNLDCQSDAFKVFRQSYVHQLDSLSTLSVVSRSSKFCSELECHIKTEWRHFLEGTYGLCTRSGLAKDIAQKELATDIIETLIKNEQLTAEEINELKRAVNLLDKASALFAPHEREQSSRRRLVDEVRNKYHLSTSPN